EPFEELVITRVIARNDKPLDAEEAKKQEEIIRARVVSARAANANTSQRKPAARNNDDDEILRGFVEALEFKLTGTEKRNGRETLVLEFSPRPNYTVKSYKLRICEKVRGKAWIDKESSQLARADAEVFETVSIGFGVVGRIAKGTTFHIERREVAPGMWLPESQLVKADARLLLVKTVRTESDTRFSEFQPRPLREAELKKTSTP